jgi:diguanylate cyclase (GGDEF)-like protein
VIHLGAADVVVGRSPDADVQVVDASISRRHARFFCIDERVFVADLGSVNRTRVRGETLDGQVELHNGDHIQLGDDLIVMFNRFDAAEEDAAAELYESSVRDATSGAYNRHHFDSQLQAELAFTEQGGPLVVMLLDIDDFTSVNDRYGHLVGDAVLRVLAASIQRTLKPSDTLARFGGDEFAVLCRDTTMRNGYILAERIRAGVERLPFAASGNDFQVTVSVGIAGGRSDAVDASSLLETADRAMYQSKETTSFR